LEGAEVDLALAQNDTPAKASVRSIALLFPEVLHLYVRADAGVDGVAGLKNKRIATLSERSGTYHCLQRLLQHYRLTDGDSSVELLPLPPGAAHRAFRSGEADAVFHAIALGATAREHIGRSLEDGAVLLPIEQVAALRTHYPYLEPAIIPKGCYRGDPPIPARNVPTAALRAVLLVRSSIPRSVVYRITHILHAHRSEIVGANPMAVELGPPGTPDQGLFPLHAGAQAYYSREKPGFMVTYAEPLALGLSLSALCVSGLWHLRLRFQHGRKNRADMYNLEILRLVKQARQVEKLGELEEVRQKLYDIFRRVLEDLDRDKISTESFQFFAFPWGVAIGAIRHRELTLTNHNSADDRPMRDEDDAVDA
jgi:TRAP transporter TAXI family solute receptor